MYGDPLRTQEAASVSTTSSNFRGPQRTTLARELPLKLALVNEAMSPHVANSFRKSRVHVALQGQRLAHM